MRFYGHDPRGHTHDPATRRGDRRRARRLARAALRV